MPIASRHPLSGLGSGYADRSSPFALVTGTVFAVAAACAVFVPLWFWAPFAAVAAAGFAILAFRHTTLFCAAWLLIAGATLEMTLSDLFGAAMYQPTIAVVKGAELGLAALCILRYGLAPDVFNPALAFLAMFVVGLVHGLHPDLGLAASLRSLAGSMAPFAFAFCRLPRNWGTAIIRMTIWLPLITLAVAGVLDLAGWRPLFFESGGQRLAGLGHPAFLAGFCLAAVYACLIALYRDGRPLWLALLFANFVILVLTGARAPLACAVAVTTLSLVFLGSRVLSRHRRMIPLLLAACLVPLILLLAGEFSVVRLFNVLSKDAAQLSGRDLLWPLFEDAAAASPWFGWGVGAGNTIIPPDGEIARLMQTMAAHNEYLRIQVEGGQLGLGLLIVLFVLWVMQHTRRLCHTDKVIMRMAFVAFAVHAYTDNVLIATTGCVFFAFATAVFVSGLREGAGNNPVRGRGPKLVLAERR
jgi:O-antigen ligase